MANRFNTLLDNQNYVETYVPLPLDFIAKQGAMKQEEFDKNKKALADSTLSNIKSISEHDPYRDKYIKGFNDQAKALLDDPNLDFGSSEGKQKVYQLIRQNAEDPNIQRMVRGIDNKKNQLENIETIKKTKDAYGYWNDPILMDQKLASMGINNYMDAKTGQTKEYEFRPMQTAENHQKGVEEIFNNLKESGYFNAYAGFSKDQTTISEGGTGWKGIPVEVIRKTTDANIRTFLNDASGQDWMRKYNFDNAEQLSQLSPEDRQKQTIIDAKNYMNNIGDTFIQNTTDSKASLKETYKFKLNADKEDIKSQLASTLAPGGTQLNPQLIGDKPIGDFINKDGTGNYTALAEAFNKKLGGGEAGMLILKSLMPFADEETLAREAKKGFTATEFEVKIKAVGKIMGLKTLEETLVHLQNVSVSANSIVLPTVDIAEGIQSKANQQFDKNAMVNSDGVSLAETEAGKKSVFQGLDLSDKNNPKFKYQITDKDGVVTHTSVSIPDTNYKNALKPIATVVNNVQDALTGKIIQGQAKQIIDASNKLIQINSKDSNIVKALGVNTMSDLAPILTQDLGGSTLYIYNDKTKSGQVRAIEVVDDIPATKTTPAIPGEIKPISEFGNYITTRTDKEFVFPISGDVLQNQLKQRPDYEPPVN